MNDTHNRAPYLNIAIGILVFCSRWVVAPASPEADWNLFITGTAIAGIGMAAGIAHGQTAYNFWSILNVATGAWLIVSAGTIPNVPWMTWPQVAFGVATIIAALVSLSNEARFAHRHRHGMKVR